MSGVGFKGLSDGCTGASRILGKKDLPLEEESDNLSREIGADYQRSLENEGGEKDASNHNNIEIKFAPEDSVQDEADIIQGELSLGGMTCLPVKNTDFRLQKKDNRYEGSFYFMGNTAMEFGNINDLNKSLVSNEGHLQNPMMSKIFRLINDIDTYL
jgi:hypothetical protein